MVIVLGLGSNLDELKARIQRAKEDLDVIGSPDGPLPEVINATNVLRTNEHLTKTGAKKSELIALLEEYSRRLEDLALSLLSIQSDMHDIIREEASLLGTSKTTRRTGGTTRTKKRPRRR